MASYKYWKCGKLYNHKQSLARYMKHKHSEEDNAYGADTDDDNDSKDIKEEDDTNFFVRYDGFGHFSCHKCGGLVTRRVWSVTLC